MNILYGIVLIVGVLGFEKSATEEDELSMEGKVYEQITSWWQEMSVQKPLIKCQPPKEWIIDSPLLKLFRSEMPVISYPCGPGMYHSILK